jgi:hypothetical protein
VVDPTLQAMLEPFEAAILADPTVLGVAYTGSLGRGTAGRYSDLDLEVWLTDEAVADAPAKTQKLLAMLGPVKMAFHPDGGFTKALVGRDWRRVDIQLREREDTEPLHEFVGARVVKDFDGAVARLVAASVPEGVTPTWEEARAAILGAIGEQFYIADNSARGALMEAAGSVPHELARLYELLARFRGRRSYGFRYVEELLSPAEQRLLAACWPAAPTQAEVRRAARELWQWTRHVWDEVERILGRSLDVTVDEADLLAAVDGRYQPA